MCHLALASVLCLAVGPDRLVDLRWLARPQSGERFVVDTLSGRDRAERVVADLRGPGVLDHLMCGRVGQMTLVVDGEQVLRCDPHKAWKRVYPAPRPAERGELPFAFPLVQVAGPYAHCALPIPFRERLIVAASRRDPKVWLTGRRLPARPGIEFSAEAGSRYVTTLVTAHAVLTRPADALPQLPGARTVDVQCHCEAGGRATLVELAGPQELVGLRMRILPGALELLRYQVIEITIDGATSVRMPLVDFLGVSHPWPHAWFPRAGDWVAGIAHPYTRSGGRVEPAIVAHLKLPIPFRTGLRIELWNRSSWLPVTVFGKLCVADLPDGEQAARLCGTSRRLDLPSEGESRLFSAHESARLVGLSMFTTGHGRDWDWRRKSRVELVHATGSGVRGPGLLPLAFQGAGGSAVFGSLVWNHNSLEPRGRCGAARHFWPDPLRLSPGSCLRYVAAGKGGPTRAEVGVLWYQPFGARSYSAPPVPDNVQALPPVVHGQSREPKPGGWIAEAEALAATAEAGSGSVSASEVGAKDAFASADAYLAWNAERPGDVLDLIAPMPMTQYARLWVHRLLFPAGGSFSIELAAADDTGPQRLLGKTDADFRTRVLGQSTSRARVECYDVWPHRQAYRFEMPIMLNPAPGERGRIRFTCASKRSQSRGYLLAIDQLGLNPAPSSPPGWHEMENTVVRRCADGAAAELMTYGRQDFYAWGGREVVARGEAAVQIALAEPLARLPVQALEIRGLILGGDWRASAGDDDARPLAQSKAKGEPSVWRLSLGQSCSCPAALTLTVTCGPGKGQLLLDAWRFVAGPERSKQ